MPLQPRVATVRCVTLTAVAYTEQGDHTRSIYR
jgi:hypothetical protein